MPDAERPPPPSEPKRHAPEIPVEAPAAAGPEQPPEEASQALVEVEPEPEPEPDQEVEESRPEPAAEDVAPDDEAREVSPPAAEPPAKERRSWLGTARRRKGRPVDGTERPEEPPAEPVAAPPAGEPPGAAEQAEPSREDERPEPDAAPAHPPPRPVPSSPPPRAMPAPPPARQRVVRMSSRRSEPREWNLWELESLARGEARREPARGEEWSYLFLHLRQFADTKGTLPTEFDGLVRETFGELLEALEPV